MTSNDPIASPSSLHAGVSDTGLVGGDGTTSGKGQINIRVLLFAAARDVAGTSEVVLSLSANATVREVVEMVCGRCPDLASLADSLLVAVNEQYAGRDDIVPDAAAVALFPPVSGG